MKKKKIANRKYKRTMKNLKILESSEDPLFKLYEILTSTRNYYNIKSKKMKKLKRDIKLGRRKKENNYYFFILKEDTRRKYKLTKNLFNKLRVKKTNKNKKDQFPLLLLDEFPSLLN
ncbi:MAG: hypothetical protein SOY60_05260 [Fusobacterium gastrosuis]|uniref:hypothetical protein n=1 Tax=Fusobacterium gastrosuis TaxID=1755100 RepID=UPI0029715DE7|nr:hypothetical protein [Fusobacteriaceae bacterium]MDY4011055.1 hypothetical protein [Fusobacterium gastrosuis]MDY5306590.1 hypothetical protein [Fusobacterium gastrosuis]MDY5714113.1 hypothetical protein [Fusobacterium gastrosuis]